MNTDDDLLGMLERGYRTHAAGLLGGVHPGMPEHFALNGVRDFVTWARAQLRKNPVVATYPVAQGLGLRLQDHTCVPLLPQPADRPMRDECIHVTNPGLTPNQSTLSPECMPVTGPRS